MTKKRNNNPTFKYQLVCKSCHAHYTDSVKSKYCSKCEGKVLNYTKERGLPEPKKEVYIPRYKIPKLRYKFELFNLNSDTLSKFIFLDNRRKLQDSQVSSLVKSLSHDKHFESPIVVNKIEGNYKIIDGNHRIEAFKKLLKYDHKFSIDCLLIIYTNLDEDQEIEVFRTWNTGRIQSIDDFIQSIAHKIEFVRWITKNKDFPVNVNVYRGGDSIGVKHLCNSLIAAQKGDDMGHGLKRNRFAEEIKDLDKDDYIFLKGFMKNYADVFGYPKYSNTYYHTVFLSAVMYIGWEFRNKDDLFNSLRQKILGNPEVIELSKYGSREATRKLIGLIKDKCLLKSKLYDDDSDEDLGDLKAKEDGMKEEIIDEELFEDEDEN